MFDSIYIYMYMLYVYECEFVFVLSSSIHIIHLYINIYAFGQLCHRETAEHLFGNCICVNLHRLDIKKKCSSQYIYYSVDRIR